MLMLASMTGRTRRGKACSSYTFFLFFGKCFIISNLLVFAQFAGTLKIMFLIPLFSPRGWPGPT